MKDNNFKYDAFISYRHCELDKFVAENLHRILENYDLPKNIKEKLNIKGKTIKRIFRDKEELPLSSNLEDPIISALKDSKYLIVICSPRLKDSLWCKKEIATFKKLRGRKNIFCVLIEGEPKDSFPEEVLYDEIDVKSKNGKIKKDKVLVEPLAADVRGINKKEILKKIKDEKLRLIAPMYNLDYDDLKQRHKLRRQRQIILTSIIVAISCFLFALYTSIMLLKINSQQKTLKLHQALTLASNATNYLNKDDRYEAIKSSYQSLTEFNNVKMPYTPEAEYALLEALGLYDIGSSYKTIKDFKTKGVIDFVKGSNDNNYIAVYDESEEITLIDSKNINVINNFKVNGLLFNEDYFTFVGNDKFAYINKDGNISLVNVSDGKEISVINKEKDSILALKGDIEGNYLTYTDYKNVYIYNIKDNELINSIYTKDYYKNKIFYSNDNKYVFVETFKENYDINKEDYITIHVINLSNGKEINNTTINAGYIENIVTKGSNAYLLLNKSIGIKYKMLVVSYNYIDGHINWTKSFDDNWGSLITKSYADNTNNIAVANYESVNVLNMSNGNIVGTYNTESKIINMYSFINKEIYLLFLDNGSVNYISVEQNNIVELMNKYEFNIDKYIDVVQSKDGFILLPKNDNRLILYEEKYNEERVKEDFTLDFPKDESINLTDNKKIKEEYNLMNKNLVDKIFYDTNKELLFVNYTNNDIAIYSTNDKKILKVLENVGKANHYFGKDKYGRIYIGDISNSYILDNEFNKVGHIKGLAQLNEDKVIIRDNDNFYSIKIYNLDDILKKAKEYLKY